MSSEVCEKLKIIGVDCPSCIYAIQKSLAKLGGVKDLKVDISSGEALVVYDGNLVGSSNIYKAIRDSGYDVYKDVLILATDAEAEEISVLEDHLRKIRGVLDYRISPITRSIKILFNPYTATRDSIISSIKKLNIGIKEVSEELMEKPRVYSRTELLVRLISFILGLTSVTYYTIGTLWLEPPLWSLRNFVLGSISTAVLFLNWRIIVNGYRAFLRGSPTMDSLVALSASTTYLFSLFASLNLIPAHEVFFEASAGVLGFIAFGKYLEERLRVKALQNLQKLLQMQQGKVRVVRDGKVEEVDVGSVNVGDVVEVKSGEKILVDGVVVDGWGYVDESMFSGEFLPRFKTAKNRDYVLAGTTLTSGYIRVRVTRVGRETSLYHIYESVREAQFSKPSSQRFADKMVGMLTWIVVILSMASFIYWLIIERNLGMAIISAAAVLSVACPCPLGIAIPMVISIASIKAMKLGLLIRDGTVFEKILNIDVALFDKTGTITFGKPEVKSVYTFNGFSDRELLNYVCSLEKRSEHPLAKAILRYCNQIGVEVEEPENYEHMLGMGVVGTVRGRQIIVGSRKLLEEFGVDISLAIGIDLEVGRKGSTAIYVAVDGRLAGLIEVSDMLREEVIETIEFIKSKGMKTVLASGDSIITAKNVAEAVGIENVYAELRPEDKAELVEKLQMSGLKVMFVGDGVNDAPALSKAFVGIAMGSGADISKEAGDVVITSNKLDNIVNLYKLSEKVRRKAVENLVWVFLYNTALIPIAMGALYRSTGLIFKPEFGAIAMILSDISVILNSFTLLKAKIHR